MGKKARVTITYSQIKQLAKKGLNIDQSAKHLGCTKREIMKVIKEHF